ncbi:MAG: hypothetical protein KME31_04930 [Tolypothrix carrinoi HA7290-LM1]|nr:hypothetical protein [Tolypothrix carrinoi HA7290-LM1]
MSNCSHSYCHRGGRWGEKRSPVYARRAVWETALPLSFAQSNQAKLGWGIGRAPRSPLSHILSTTLPPIIKGCFPKDHLEVQAQSLKRNIRSNLLPASSQILRSRNLNSGKARFNG